MESEGPLGRHVFRSVLGRRDQTRKTCATQTASPPETGGSSRRSGSDSPVEYHVPDNFRFDRIRTFHSNARRIHIAGYPSDQRSIRARVVEKPERDVPIWIGSGSGGGIHRFH